MTKFWLVAAGAALLALSAAIGMWRRARKRERMRLTSKPTPTPSYRSWWMRLFGAPPLELAIGFVGNLALLVGAYLVFMALIVR